MEFDRFVQDNLAGNLGGLGESRWWQESVFPRSMDAMNTDWHAEHPLGPKAPMPERVRWHIQHAEKCACRPIPQDVKAAMTQRAADCE